MKSINNGNLNSIQQIQPDVLAQGRLDWIELISGLISVQFAFSQCISYRLIMRLFERLCLIRFDS